MEIVIQQSELNKLILSDFVCTCEDASCLLYYYYLTNTDPLNGNLRQKFKFDEYIYQIWIREYCVNQNFGGCSLIYMHQVVHGLVIWFVSHTPLEALWGWGFSLIIPPTLKGIYLQTWVGLSCARFWSDQGAFSLP